MTPASSLSLPSVLTNVHHLHAKEKRHYVNRTSMKRFLVIIGCIFFRLSAAQYYTCISPTCISPYDEFPILRQEVYNTHIPQGAYSSGNFTHPAPVNRNSSDISNVDHSLNERIPIGTLYQVQWMQNVSKNASWDLYIINEHSERYFLNSMLDFWHRLE